MPYIKKQDRPKYQPIVDGVMVLIGKEYAPLEQANFYGRFVEVLIHELQRVSNPRIPKSVGATGRDAKFSEYAILAATTLPANPEVRAGELNYLLSTIAWGLLGAAPGRDHARYAMRAFIKGALWRSLLSMLSTFNPEEYIFYTGVITDVIDEMYRRKTSVFEDDKILENGDIC